MTTHPAADDLALDYQVALAIDAPVDSVFEALTTVDGLAGWWTPVTGNGRAGGELVFSFGPQADVTMRVDTADANDGVRWAVLECHVADWVGTSIHFDLEPGASGGTDLRFRHAGLTPQLECFGDCKSGWDHFTASLKAYAETGTGQPNQSDADLARREERARGRS